jgi:hypothetical protein
MAQGVYVPPDVRSFPCEMRTFDVFHCRRLGAPGEQSAATRAVLFCFFGVGRMAGRYKRVNILITQSHYDEVAKKGLSLSGLVRDLLEDRFSETTITLSVKKESKLMYDHIISNFGITDQDLAEYVVEALDKFLVDKGKEIEKLRVDLRETVHKR